MFQSKATGLFFKKSPVALLALFIVMRPGHARQSNPTFAKRGFSEDIRGKIKEEIGTILQNIQYQVWGSSNCNNVYAAEFKIFP